MEHNDPHQSSVHQQTQPHITNEIQQAAPHPSAPGAAISLRLYVIGGFRFECPLRYTVQRLVGRGAYGMVCAAFDHVNQQQVAIKRINGVTQEETDCRRTLREMLLLRHFTHEHIVSLKDVYIPAVNMHNFQEVYFVTDLMEFDLHQLISSNQPISADHTRYLTYQLLNGLKYIHSAGVLHRDLKPSNILLTQECQLKICDLGLARDAPRTPYTQNRMTSYVATRWYRAPEIMFGAPYTSAVDVWSVGCIVAEILLRRPIFPGRTYEEQLVKVAQTLGPPPPDLLNSLAPPAARKFAQSRLSHFPKRDVSNLFPYAPQALCDLLARMFEYDPSKRITVVEALTHPYLVALHDVADEPICETRFQCNLDREALNNMKQRIWNEAEMYRIQREAEDKAVRSAQQATPQG